MFISVFQLLHSQEIKKAESKKAKPEIKYDYLKKAFKTIGDSLIKSQNVFNDSILKSFNSINIKHTDSLKFFADSFINSYKDTINKVRQDSIIAIKEKLILKLSSYPAIMDNLLKNEIIGYSKSLSDLGESLLINTGNNDGLLITDSFNQVCDSLSDELSNNTENLTDSIINVEQDEFENSKDSLNDFAESILDNSREEMELTEDKMEAIQDSIDEAYAKSSKFEFVFSYNNHDSYRGRDNGIFNQYYFSPSLTYEHSSGLSLYFSTFIFHKSPGLFDQTGLGAAYENKINENFGFSFAYSHFWFDANSYLSKSDLNNSIEVSLTFSALGFDLNPSFNIDFATNKEINFFIYLTYNFEAENISGIKALRFEPSLLYVFGEQNKNLIKSRKKKIKGHIVIIDSLYTKNLLSAMDYEITAPVTLDFGNFNLRFYLSYIVPVNVVDESYKKHFISAGMDFIFHF